MTFAERRAARQANREERRANRRPGSNCEDEVDEGDAFSACSGGSKGSHKSHGSKDSNKSRGSKHSNCSSKSSKSSNSSKSSRSSCSARSSHSSRSSNCSRKSNQENECGGEPVTYAMKEKLLAFGNDFIIDKMDDSEGRRRGQQRRGNGGEPAFYVDNKVVRVRETFNIRSSPCGEVLYQVQERKMRVRDAMAIEDGDGEKIAEIKQRVVGVVRDNYVIKIQGERDWVCHGSILEHDFTIKENGKLIAKIHKKWLTPVKDRYFIDVEESEDAALVLMVAVGLEEMSD